MKLAIRWGVLLLGLVLVTACNPVRPPAETGEAPPTTVAPEEAVSVPPAAGSDAAGAMAALLARQLGVDAGAVTVVSSETVEWPDACLGVTLEGEMCAQVITPGYKIVLAVDGAEYTFHTDQGAAWYRLVDGPEVQVGERLAAWQGLADNGACRQATFGTQGVAFGDCGGVLLGGRYVSEARLATLQEMAATYAPFQANTEAGTVDFAGTGSTTASSEQQAAVARWLQTATMEAAAGQSFGGLRYDGPAELGTGDTSRCAVLQMNSAEAQVWDCEGNVTTVPPTADQADVFDEITSRFGSFVYETPGEVLTFEGMGRQVDPMWQRALLAWARVTRAELASGQTSATARTAVSWHLGAVPDMPDVCAHLTVLDYGYVYAEQRGCESGEVIAMTEDWLDEGEMEQFDRWLYAYAPFYADDNYLNGVGTDPMPEEEVGALRTWAEETWMRLTGLPVALAGAAGTEGTEGTEASIAADTACDAGSVDAGSVDAAGVFTSAAYGFCLQLPEGYAMMETAPGSFSLVKGGDIMDHSSPRIGIEVSAAGDRTLAGIADQMMADYAPVGTNVTAQPIMVHGVDGVLLDNLPGQDLNRRIVLLRNGQVYSLMFMPLSPEAEPLYRAVLDSLRFLN